MNGAVPYMSVPDSEIPGYPVTWINPHRPLREALVSALHYQPHGIELRPFNNPFLSCSRDCLLASLSPENSLFSAQSRFTAKLQCLHQTLSNAFGKAQVIQTQHLIYKRKSQHLFNQQWLWSAPPPQLHNSDAPLLICVYQEDMFDMPKYVSLKHHIFVFFT